MDWFLDPADEGAPRRFRAELKDYLTRHSSEGSVVDDAELAAWELVANAFRHAHGPCWVTLDWSDLRPLLEVHDLGSGFDLDEGLAKVPGPHGGFGLKLADEITEQLRVRAKAAGGARVSAVLPVTAAQGRTATYREASSRSRSVVPLAPSADADGSIGKEPFLVGIIVNLMHAIEVEDGPERARSLVNEVGGRIGAEMELAFRAARGIEGPLTPEQMGELFVQLKAAIGGGFSVTDLSENSIVLHNTACPFGSVVQQAPSLCQMTSAVFGGIAARNGRSSRVVLEDRIALGDPGCWVEVQLESTPVEVKSSQRDPDSEEASPSTRE